MKSMNIAFSGIDGSGKTTQIKLVKNNLSNASVLISKIDYSPLNKMNKNKLTDMYIKCKSGIEIIKYYSFIQNVESLKYDYILFDRHLACYLAYAYAYGSTNLKLIRKILSMVKEADLTLYYDVDVDLALERINKRGSVNKSENKYRLSKAKEGYEMIFDIIGNVYRIDANKDENEVYQKTIKYIKQ